AGRGRGPGAAQADPPRAVDARRARSGVGQAFLSRAVRLAPCDAQELVTLLVDIGNMGFCQLMIPCCRFPEATPMPQPLSVPLRQEIVRRHQQGLPLTRIAADLAIPYGTVRKIWRLYRRGGLERLAPDYSHQGRPVPSNTRELLRIACEIKREHPG